jgi:hypothetical protein
MILAYFPTRFASLKMPVGKTRWGGPAPSLSAQARHCPHRQTTPSGRSPPIVCTLLSRGWASSAAWPHSRQRGSRASASALVLSQTAGLTFARPTLSARSFSRRR